MKGWANTKFRWLTFKSFRSFFDLEELILLILPTSYAYYDDIPKLFCCSPLSPFFRIFFLVSAALVCITLILYTIYKKFTEHERSIADLLEVGYFNNFFHKTVILINEKNKSNEEVDIIFKDEEKHVTISPKNIKLKLTLPESKTGLEKTIKKIDMIAKDATMNKNVWIKAKKNDDGSITIYECPRTLTTISMYLTNQSKSYSEEQSKILHSIFNTKFDQDWNNSINDIPINLVTKNHVFEE